MKKRTNFWKMNNRKQLVGWLLGAVIVAASGATIIFEAGRSCGELLAGWLK